MSEAGARCAVEIAFREEWGRVVATLIRRTGDWDLAEECAQEAFTQALARWPADGVPERPGAWLTTVASNRALDRLRRARRGAELLEQAGRDPTRAPGQTMTDSHDSHDSRDDEAPDGNGIEDDRLRLIFTCCHPALALEGRVALTLRSLAGLTTPEIARAFLVSEATMAKRLTRAKAKIARARIPYRVPPGHLLPERTGGVLAVLYLLFNEGYAASGGERLIRGSLCDEAIRLARLLAALMPDEPEAAALLALMLLAHSRRAARLDEAGEIVTLEHQDRGAWDAAEIDEASALLRSALARKEPGPYQLQAAIAACHSQAPTAAATDWPQIASLYELLERCTASPVVRLNRAVAVAMAGELDAGLALVEELAAQGTLDDYHLLDATRADLHRRRGDREAAAAAYRRALAAVRTEPERRYLARRLAEVQAGS
ncbi:MAG: RNA polymerase sigma factor [Solirubrobacteraceae bacterium]